MGDSQGCFGSALLTRIAAVFDRDFDGFRRKRVDVTVHVVRALLGQHRM